MICGKGSRYVQRSIDYYNLDMILAIGYRVRSYRGTQFRRWATERLREYLIKGFVLDDERLKDQRTIGADYFDPFLQRQGQRDPGFQTAPDEDHPSNTAMPGIDEI